ncbi:unnamed protein product [Rhizoctonia solani]|uniref:NB-ARC domain-containing protein n=1 Tax=Rhizoctonia solani TaxID=456999 RepID=A0A8H3E1R6_9AGAM|nr:unnamed protein product [Rhizoctonia solani]
MAHPDLFKSIDIVHSGVSQSFVGGEIGCSNPLVHVLSEVKRLYPDRHVACIISIGAGHARIVRVPDPSRWYRTQDMVVAKDMAVDGERVAEEVGLRFQGRSGVYFRLNVDQGMQNMKSGSWEKLGEATQHTQAYLQKNETNQKLDEAARASVERREAVSTTHAAGQIPAIIEATKRLVGFKRCPAPTVFYTGREDENMQVIACITGGKGERRVCVIYGLGGVGKTQLAFNVVERTWDEWDHVIYVDASSNEAIEKSLKEFAEARDIGQSYTDSIQEKDTEAADDLVLDFGCLALAIVHAGAFIAHSPSMTISKYRSLFLSQRRRMLEEYKQLPDMAKLDERGDTVYTTWRMCYDQLKPESRELLWLIAYMHYDGISEEMFKRAAQNMHTKEYPLPPTDREIQARGHVQRLSE